MDTPSSGSKCTLLSGLYALQTKAGFTASQNVTYTTWVQSLETSIVLNASYSTAEAKLAAVATAFQQFELEYSAIYTKVQYLNISTWGPVDTVCQVTKEWNYEASIELVLQSSADGNCKLFDLLLEKCSGDSEKYTALKAFIDSRLKAIVSNSALSETECLVEINKAFTAEFFVGAQASWSTYFYSLQLESFSFAQWSSVAITYQQQTEYSVVLSGQGMDCPFILSLNATLSSTAYTNTQKGFIKQLMNYFIQQWTTVTTVEARLALISMKFSESIDLSYSYFACLNSIPLSGGFSGCWGAQGSWWDLIVLSCQKPTLPTDCGCVKPTWAPEVPPTTAAPTEVTEGTTVEASTTEASSDTTWDSTFSSITFGSTTPECSCSCEM
jgi:hypothetical protein